MREVTIKIYKVDELSEKARTHAHQEYIAEGWTGWDQENYDSLNKFMAVMPVKSWHVDGQERINVEPNGDELWNLQGTALQTALKDHGVIGTWKEGGCDITGYCMDCPLTDIFWHFMQLPEPSMKDNEMCLEQLISIAYYEWKDAVEEEVEYHNSLKHFMEDSRANDWEYYENGELY